MINPKGLTAAHEPDAGTMANSLSNKKGHDFMYFGLTKEKFNQLIAYWNFMYPNNRIEPVK